MEIFFKRGIIFDVRCNFVDFLVHYVELYSGFEESIHLQ